MNNAIFDFENPHNEQILNYAPGSNERILLTNELKNLETTRIEIPLIIDGREVTTGKLGKVVMPHDHGHVLATYHIATEKEVKMAIDAAMKAHEAWAQTDWTVRAAILLKAAELLSHKYRYLINAATMLGQSKNAH